MIGRREFVGFGGAFVASSGLTANTKVPPKDFSQQRSMETLANIDVKDMRIMVIGAHPDDADLTCGCTAISFAKRGARVKFVSVTNGDKGHQTMTPPELARRRKKETEVSAKRFGIEEYIVMGCPDCELEPTLEWRKKMIRMIREFSPHIIFLLSRRATRAAACSSGVPETVVLSVFFSGGKMRSTCVAEPDSP